MNLKKILAVLLSLTMVLAVVNVPVFATENVELPTATVTEIDVEGLTFALNFKADEVTDEQFNAYKNWYADFELTINKDVTFSAEGVEDGTADGYLAGQYDEWSENWVNVPFGGKVATIKADEPLKIMAYAAELMGKPGLKVTYSDIVKSVKDFDCGVFFTPEFLAANPDLEVTLSLNMYNPENEEESYTIGETYAYDIIPAPALPQATVSVVENDDLTFALNFKADDVDENQLAYYGDWYADFEITINKDVTFDADGNGDGYLSGQYDAWSENWVNVPFGGKVATVKAGEPVKIMAYAAELMGKPGLKFTYRDIYESVKDFNCGVFFTPEFLAANPDLEVTLSLNMYNPENEEEAYTIGETYVYDEIPVPELPQATVTVIENDDLTFALNFKADEVDAYQLAYYGDWYADFEITINKDVTFNADGNGDGYLSGQYDAWSENWVNVPFGGKVATVKAGEPLKIMAYAAELMGKKGLKFTYREVYESVKDFDCGVFFTPEFLAANPDLEVTLSLNMYNPANEEEAYAIGATYKFDLVSVDVDMTDVVTVSTNQAKEGNLVVVASYDKAGRLLETKTMMVGEADFDKEVVAISTSVTDLGLVRAFLLDGFDNLTPLCESDFVGSVN